MIGVVFWFGMAADACFNHPEKKSVQMQNEGVDLVLMQELGDGGHSVVRPRFA